MAQEQPQGGPTDAVPSKRTIWAGRILSAVPVLMMAMSAVMKLLRNPAVLADWGPRFEYPEGTLLAIGVVELACAVLYALPRTAVLGAILVTGYLGGATTAHVRIGEAAFVAPVVLGILAWGGLFLRDPRLRARLPLRRDGEAGLAMARKVTWSGLSLKVPYFEGKLVVRGRIELPT